MPVLPSAPSDFTATLKSAAFINAVIGGVSFRPSKNSGGFVSLGALGAIVTQSATARASISQRFDPNIAPPVVPDVVAEPPVVGSITTGNTTGSADALIIRYNTSGGLQWVRRIAGTSSDQTVSVSSDSSNNVYAFGYCLGPASVFAADGTTVAFSFTAADEFVRTSFIVKYNSLGTPLWLARIVPASPSSIVSDSSGNTYVTGFFSGSSTAVVDATGTQTVTLSSFALEDAFVIKYNTSGIPQWIRRIGRTGDQRGLGINVDSSGNVYVSGYYTSSLAIIAANGTDNALTLPTPTSSDAFIVKYDADGTPLWVRRIGGAGADSGVSISVNSSGVYVVGTLGGSASVFAADGTTESIALGNSGSTDAFVVKYTTDGGPQWARRIAGSSNETGVGVALDSTGVYVVGTYPVIANVLDSNGSSAITLPISSSTATFVVKYSTSGVPLWARGIVGSSIITGKSISSNSTEIYVAGSYRSTISILDATEAEKFALTNAGNTDGFIVRYSADGTPEWARKISGAGFDEGLSISSTASAVYIGGYTEGAATITSTT